MQESIQISYSNKTVVYLAGLGLEQESIQISYSNKTYEAVRQNW